VAALPLVEKTVPVGETVDLSTTLYPIGGNADGLTFEWKSSSSRATVSGNGTTATVTGVSAGSPTVTLTISNPDWAGSTKKLTLTCAVKVIVPTPPSKPQNVTATPGDGTVTLNWSAPADDGGSAVTQYEVSPGSGTWIASNGETSHTFNDLTNATQYSFRVRAVNAIGGGDAETVSATPSATLTEPGKPRELSAATDDGRVTLTWSAPESNGGSAVTEYRVSKDNGTTWDAVSNEDFSHTFTGLVNGTTYSFQVRAVNDIGDGEPESVTATPITVASAPQNLEATPSDGKLSLTWAAPEDDGGSAITGYKVSLGDSEWYDADGATSHTFSGLTNGKSYTLRVMATNATGDGMVASVQARLPNSGVPSEDEDDELAGGGDSKDEDDANVTEDGKSSDDVDEEDIPASGGTAMDTVSAETVKESDIAQAANTAGLPERSLVPDEDGNLVFDADEALVIAQKTWPSETIETVNSLPIKTAVVKTSGGIAALEFTVKGSRLFADRPDDITVLKVKGGAAGDSFSYSTPSAGYADRTYTLRKSGKPHHGPILPDESYTLLLFVKDGGAFDLDRTPGKVLDPAVIVKKTARKASAQDEDGEKSPSGGGCGSGAFGIAALMALAAAIAAAKKKAK
jgi:hypothetical protein